MKRLAFLALLLSACGEPPPPAPATGGMDPGARARIDELYAAAARAPRDAEATGRLGMALHALGRIEAAEGYYRRAAERAPGEFRWAYLLGVVEAARGRPTAASTLARAVELDGRSLPARLALGAALIEAGDLDRAEAAFRALPEPHARAEYGLGRIAELRGDPAAAAARFERACALFRDFAAARLALARACRALGRSADAERELARAEAARGGEPPVDDPILAQVEALAGEAFGAAGRGAALLAAGRDAEAAQALAAARERGSADLSVYANAIVAAARAGDAAGVERAYRDGLTKNPDFADGHFNYAVWLARRGEFERAADLFRKVLAIEPGRAEALLHLGVIEEQSGRRARALAAFGEAVANDPRLAEARFRFGRLLLADGRAEEAARHFAVAVDIEPRAEFRYGLAAALAARGEREAAAAEARRALKAARAGGDAALAAAIEKDLANWTSRPPGVTGPP